MKTFCSIIQQHIESSTNLYVSLDKTNITEYIHTNKKNEKNDLIINLFHTYIIRLFYNTQQFMCKNKKFITICKFKELHKMLNNIFLSKTQKEEFLTIFCKTQRTYYALSRFANIVKYKIASLQINTDLYMNDIKETDKNVFTVIQNKSKYLFIISDLINILNNNLSNSSYFFPEPLIPKNPYNNLPFNNSTLYNIYFFIRFNVCVMPKLIQGYFLSNLDLSHFEYNNEGLIRETFIKNYIFTTHYETLHPIVINMLNEYKIYNKKIFIHEDFPKDKLVDIMRPYLHLYYLSKYYISGSSIKQCSTIKLHSRLRSFVNFNPNFGKKKISIIKNSSTVVPGVQSLPDAFGTIQPIPNVFRFSSKKIIRTDISFNYIHVNFNSLDFESDIESDTESESETETETESDSEFVPVSYSNIEYGQLESIDGNRRMNIFGDINFERILEEGEEEEEEEEEEDEEEQEEEEKKEEIEEGEEKE